MFSTLRAGAPRGRNRLVLDATLPHSAPAPGNGCCSVRGDDDAAVGGPPAPTRGAAGRPQDQHATRQRSHTARVARAREGAAYLWCRVGGQTGRALAAALGCSHQAISAAATRGDQAAARWTAVWQKLQ